MFMTFLANACAAGFGATAGALVAYFLACKSEKKRHEALQKHEYLCLLLIVYEELESLYTTFAGIPTDAVREINDVKVVEFDLPLPKLNLSPEQMQTLMTVAPDKQMPSTLIKVQHFLNAHSLRAAKSGNILPLNFILQQTKQLEFMLASVRTQYEQASNDPFPLDVLPQK